MMYELLLFALVICQMYISIRWPAKAVMLLATIFPAYLLRFTFIGVPTNVFEAFVGILFLAQLASSGKRAKLVRAVRAVPIGGQVLVVAFVVAAVISVSISPELRVSLGILKSWILVPIVAALLVYAHASERIRLLTWHLDVLDLVMGSGVVMALLGIAQVGSAARVQGIYDVPNSLALFIAPLIIAALYRFLNDDKKTLYAGIVVVMMAALLATQSIGGIGTVIVVGGILLLRHGRGLGVGRNIVVAGIVLAIVVGVVLSTRVPYLLTPGSSAYVRLQLWSVGTELIAEKPLLGIGLGQFEAEYQAKLHQRFLGFKSYTLRPVPEFVFRDPHNWIISFWVNMGALGLFSFIGLHVLVLRNPKQWSAAHWALLALVIFGLVDTVYWKNDLAVSHWVLLGLAGLPIFRPL